MARKIIGVVAILFILLVILRIVKHSTPSSISLVVETNQQKQTETPLTKIPSSSSPPVAGLVSKTETPIVKLFPQIVSGNYNFSLITDDSLTRTYRVYIPKNYDPSKSYPALFVFHGGFGTAEQIEKSSHFSILADERGYIVVYGQGTSLGGVIEAPTWNAGGCCGQAQEDKKNVDDVNYVRDVLAEVKLKYNINPLKIYAAGMSNGGMFSNRLACEAADQFARTAVVAGTIQVKSCNPSKRMPVFIMHGTKDKNVPYYGGTGSKAVNQSTYIPVEQELAEWGMRNGCSGAVITTSVPPLVNDGITIDKLTFPSCVEPVVLYRVNGGVHEWPGGGPNDNVLEKPSATQSINASKTILDFFNL